MRFLRLFRAFQLLEAQLASSDSARIKAEDDTRLWRARADAAESERDRAKLEASTALKQVSNWQSLQMGCANVPFPDVYTPMPRPPETEGSSGPPKRLARDVQNERNLAARLTVMERLRRPE